MLTPNWPRVGQCPTDTFSAGNIQVNISFKFRFPLMSCWSSRLQTAEKASDNRADLPRYSWLSNAEFLDRHRDNQPYRMAARRQIGFSSSLLSGTTLSGDGRASPPRNQTNR